MPATPNGNVAASSMGVTINFSCYVVKNLCQEGDNPPMKEKSP